MKETLYSRPSNIIIGFHGCDKSIANMIVTGKDEFNPSTNDYDWLGHGIYFWENNEERAFQWAKEESQRPNSKIKEPAVIGAIIDLGYCLNLVESRYLQELKTGYKTLEQTVKLAGIDMPVNTSISHCGDFLVRKLDCAVIETIHQLNRDAKMMPYDSVRGVFWEGDFLYPGAGFKEKNHIQVCVINPNCIKGVFFPRSFNVKYSNP